MPVPTTDSKHIARQFVPNGDPKYGLYTCLSDEEYDDIGGRVWYNEQRELNQM